MRRAPPRRRSSGPEHCGDPCLSLAGPIAFGPFQRDTMPRANMNSSSGPQTVSQQAALLHRSGKLREAEQLYLAALAVDSRDVTALHLLGVLRAQQGQLAEA